RMNPIGRCNDLVTFRELDWRRLIEVSTWAPTSASRPSIVTLSRTLVPGRILNERGSTETFQPAPLAPLVRYRSVRPETFTTVRVVVIRPGMTGALIDGMFMSIAFSGSE